MKNQIDTIPNTNLDKRFLATLFLLLYVSMDTLLFGTNNNASFITLGQVFYVICAIVFGFRMLIEKRRFFPIVVFLLIYILLSAIVNIDFTGGVVLQLSAIVIGASVVSRYSFDFFVKNFDFLFYYLTLVGFIFWVAYLLFPDLFTVFPVVYNTGEKCAFVFTGINNIIAEGFAGGFRNCLFFREPGVFAVFLIFMLAVNLFYYKNINKWNVAIYVIGIITTLSTAGYILLLSLLFLFFMSKKNSKGVVSTVLLFLVFLIAYNYFKDDLMFAQIFGKLNADSDSYASTLSRKSSFILPLYLSYNHPVFGAGLTGFTNEYLVFSKQIYHTVIDPSGNATNTMLNIAATYGIPVGVSMVIILVRFVNYLKPHSTLLFKFLFTIILFGALSNEDLRYSAIIYIFLFYGIKENHIHRQLR